MLVDMSTRVPAESVEQVVLPVWSPMLAVAGPLPGADAEAQFGFEPLFNGARVLVYLPGDGGVRLVSGMGQDVTAGYPELGVLPGLLPSGLVGVLDGEIVALGKHGGVSVERLQRRMSVRHPVAVAEAAEVMPAQLVVYDILFLGEPVLHAPFTARRALLDDLGVSGPHVVVPPYWPAMASEALHYIRQEGYDGVVAKRLTSTYLPGRRSRDWIKVKNLHADGS
jgi:bifunctional non-homologous end joining protein LigD